MNIKLLAYPLILLSLSSCVPVVAASSVAIGATVAEERTSGTVVDDAVISMRIREDLLQTNIDELLARVSITVNEGRVLLTGTVSDEKYISESSSIAWKADGVREVINEVTVNTRDLRNVAKDTYIANAVRSRLLLEKDLRSVNYSVDTYDSVVYLIGIAQNENELKRALKIAGSIKGVNKVINHVILKSDKRRFATYNHTSN